MQLRLKKQLIIVLLGLLGVSGLVYSQGKQGEVMTDKKAELATFAGGCFWCMQPGFDLLKGVSKSTVGYTGGKLTNPSYEQVIGKNTGHYEAIQVEFDPTQVSYEQVLAVFWQNINPTQDDGQFFDVGPQYKTAIFYHDAQQQKRAEASKQNLNRSGKFKQPIVTEIIPAKSFYAAEEYHQKYYQKNPLHYKSYKKGSGREEYLNSTWGKDKKAPSPKAE